MFARFLPLLIGFVGASVIWPPLAPAQIRPNTDTDNRGPIAISADRLEADDANGLVTFFDSVVARQGDMTITCDVMKVFYLRRDSAEKKSGEAKEEANPLDDGSRSIDRVECEGNVKVVEGDRLAVGDKGVYLASSLPRRIILTGEAKVWQGRDSVTGHQVTYYLDSQRSLVEGSRRQRVRTTYHQEP